MQAQGQTDIGRMRQVNQDYVFTSVEPIGPFPNLYLLADGMGGYKGGDYASKYLVDTLVNYIKKTKNAEVAEVLTSAISMSNSLIFEKSHTDRALKGMGSTLVAAVIEDSLLTVANAGDSRLYIIRDGIRQITKDHSYVREMMDKGLMEMNSKEYFENKHLLTRAVGYEDRIAVDFFDEELSDGDYVLLCSDGLTNMISDDAILSIVSGNGSIKYKTNALIEEANKKGGYDNIAVILIKYEEGGDLNA